MHRDTHTYFNNSLLSSFIVGQYLAPQHKAFKCVLIKNVKAFVCFNTCYRKRFIMIRIGERFLSAQLGRKLEMSRRFDAKPSKHMCPFN